jgi:hypothetical protein
MTGFESFVMKRPTTPLISGTTQSSNGNEIDLGRPPTIIWQNKVDLSLSASAGESNVNLVPGPTLPVFVIWSTGLAGTPRSQPEIKGPARARTSEGVRPKSKACEMAEPVPDRMFKRDW